MADGDAAFRNLAGPSLALGSALLFGASTPFAKMLLGQGTSPWLLAGILYLGSAVGLTAVAAGQRLLGKRSTEAPLRRADWPRLALVVLSGGIIAPLLLMFGLARTSASSAALLLNVEGLATMAVAWLFYREYVDRRLLLGAAAIVTGAIVLAWPGGSVSYGLGALAILGACFGWALDNNFTRQLSASDPVQIAAIKGGVAGIVNISLALAAGARLPHAAGLAGAALTGFLGYGVSLVLFVLALRALGTARTSAYFSTAPFIGAALSIAILHESLSVRLVIAGVLMAIGVYIHCIEAHEHEHAHELLQHEHRHRHDEHHQHAHRPDDPPGEVHSHWHRHLPMTHQHAHYPDLHHRHGHQE